MKARDNRLTRQAYLDDQLPLEEVISFEEDLDDKARAELEDQRRFEEALGEHLNAEVACPDALWKRLEQQVHFQPAKPHGLWLFSQRNRLRIAVAAACVLVAIVAAMVHNGNRSSNGNRAAFTGMLPADTGTCNRLAEIPGDIHKVIGALKANNIFLKLTDPTVDQGPHPIKLLGMRMMQRGGDSVAQIFFDCCGEPISVFIVPLNSKWSASELPMRYAQGEWRILQREIATYRIVAVGNHDPGEVLKLFS